MQKKSNQNRGAPDGGILISIDNLNSPFAIKKWIQDDLDYSDPDLSNDDIIRALEGISADKIFRDYSGAKKSEFISKINELIQKLRNEKI